MATPDNFDMKNKAEVSDATLVLAIRRWRREALQEAYGRHAGEVLRRSLELAPSPSAAEDAVEHAFLTLWNEPDRFDSEENSLRELLLVEAGNHLSTLSAPDEGAPTQPKSTGTEVFEQEEPDRLEALWDRVVRQLDLQPPPLRLAPMEKPKGESWAKTHLGTIAAAAGVVAATAFLVTSLALLRTSDRLADLEERLADGTVEQAALAADVDPTNTHLTLVSIDGQYAVDAVLTEERRGFVVGGELPTLPDDRTYQLWALSNGQSISLGLIGKKVEPTAFLLPTGADALAISEEGAGGSVVPSGDPLVNTVRRITG